MGGDFFVTLNNARKSQTKQFELSFFLTGITGQFHGDLDGLIISFSIISWICELISFIHAKRSLFGLILKDKASLVIMRCLLIVFRGGLWGLVAKTLSYF